MTKLLASLVLICTSSTSFAAADPVNPGAIVDTALTNTAKMIQAATAEVVKEQSSTQAQISILNLKLTVDASGIGTAVVQTSAPNPPPLNCMETTLTLTPNAAATNGYTVTNPDGGDDVAHFCAPL